MARSAIISGGGIGGLATAAALAQRGWDVTVYERQSELRAAGSGIYIWENGLRVLEALGAYEEATEGAFHGTHFEQRDNLDQIIESAPIASDKRLLTVLRSRLLGALKSACERAGVKVVTNAETIGATASGELLLASGQTVRADLAVGVDGVWSRVRQSLGLELLHEQTREGALRTMIASRAGDFAAQDVGKYIENWNGTRRLLVTPVNATQIYLALTCLQDDEARNLPLDRQLWIDAFPRWAHLIERIGDTLSWGVYSVTRSRAWSAGRTAIVGDAAHAQPPNLGQGGGMAMQNGLAMAVALEQAKDPRDIPSALQAWEAAERPLVEHCQRWSILYGEVTCLPDAVRSQVIRSAMGDAWVAGQVFKAANSSPTGTVAPRR
ncbi:FAD-dependent oxidoreductase [Variovorax saccharolyticus]|uniref:FAD-dependent oxidoreductase n=1 Tax=Variovorax saccharolyticus TaxID=3053516 RepID=UPI0025781A61|nr:NAD(P)/FAD-dependent oxidoreductase [Variovorax sp. J31P216]MDM0025283.1 NAD(P)/FAD-dependent oxidoreductase [Variovorax sp. J31P216]